MIRKILLSLFFAISAGSPLVVGREMPADARPVTPAAQQEISDQSLQELGTVVENYIEKDYAVGAELQVIQYGKTLFHQSWGLSDKESERSWENDTLCNIRSMTKPITSTAAQILIDRKLLKLDEAVATYLESFDNDASRSITVRQILTHRSGLPLTNLMHPYQYKSLAEQVAAAGEEGPEFEPDSKFWYSDTGTDVVAAVVEKVSGEPINEFVQREIFEPLGMSNSLYGFSKTDERLSKAACAYKKTPKGWLRFWKPGIRPLYPFAWGSQTVYSTTTDYAKFLKMLMNHGRVGDRQVLSPAAVQRMQEPVSVLTMMGSDNRAPTGFRNLETWYGQMLVTHHVRGLEKRQPLIIGHSGSDGNNAWAWPGRDLVIVYFTQSRGGMTPLRIEEFIDRLIINAGVVEEAPAELRPYLGTYIANYDDFDNEKFTVKYWSGKLVLDVPSQLAFELNEPNNEGQWAFAVAPKKIHVTFDRNENNDVIGLRLHKGGKVYEVPRQERLRDQESPDETDGGKNTQTTTWTGTIHTGRQELLKWPCGMRLEFKRNCSQALNRETTMPGLGRCCRCRASFSVVLKRLHSIFHIAPT